MFLGLRWLSVDKLNKVFSHHTDRARLRKDFLLCIRYLGSEYLGEGQFFIYSNITDNSTFINPKKSVCLFGFIQLLHIYTVWVRQGI